MTQIDSINRMLRYIGELPVPTTIVIDNLPEGHEARVAKTILSETSRELQEKGWWFNTEDWEFIPDDTGYITIPDSVISITPSTTREKYMVKGGDLYDVTNKTKIFTTNVTLKTVFESDFEDLPSSFATLTTYVASKHLHTYLNGDETTQKELENNIIVQTLKVEREDINNKNINFVRGSRLIDRTTNPSPLV